MKKNGFRLLAALLIIAIIVVAAILITRKNAPVAPVDPVATDVPGSDPEIKPINGIISEIYEDGSFLVRNGDGSDVLVKVSENTVTERAEALAAKQFVLVDYNGIMTRSLPPQITAERIYGMTLQGTVSSIEGRDVSLDTETLGQVIVHIPDDMALPALNEQILVHYDGVMTLSLPGQISALMIESVPDERAR